MVPDPYRYCFKLFDFFRSCKILFGLVEFKTAPDRMSGNVWEVFVNTAVPCLLRKRGVLRSTLASSTFFCGKKFTLPLVQEEQVVS